MLVVIAWGIDLRAHDGQVVRNVDLAGRSIGGMTRGQIAAVVRGVAREFEGARIRVSAPGGGFATDAATLGVSVSEPATVDSVFSVGRRGAVVARLWGWMRSLAVHSDAPLRIRIDRAAVYRTVREKDPGTRVEPKEPSIKWDDDEDRFSVVEGEPGRGLDAHDVIDALPSVAARGAPFIVSIDRGEVEPRWSEDDASALAERAAEVVDSSVSVRAGEAGARVTPAMARPWVRAEATDSSLTLALDQDSALDDLAKLLKDAGTPATETRFEVDGGVVKIIAGSAGTKCCAHAAVTRLEEALFSPSSSSTSSPVTLPLTTRLPALTVDEARALKIVEPVATFRTAHKAGEPRVTNIHHIADLVRGAVIAPGKTFSVNTFVGRRTTARGFVAAPVIEEGRFSEGVGGGVSQFATTLFNAAFLAGLEFKEYQSHSIYISRYPYGREATLSYPKPDLILSNPTPYGVLIWPTYDATSITVTLYSTRYVDASQTGQTRSPRGNCTRVSTERTRKYLDGRTEVDHVFATYRPKEGVNC